MERLSSTPFGQRPVTSGLLATLDLAENQPQIPHVDKWELFRQLCTARLAFGLSDRTLAVLNGLLSFHPETRLGGNQPMVVFPSNRALAERCHGMAESTLRRHLADLVTAGLLLRHDSPNGKRYAARNREGDVVRAFGFDLRPLLARAPEIAQAAQAAEEAAAYLCGLRERVTLLRRDVQKLAVYAIETGAPGDWEAALLELLDLQRHMRRKLDAVSLRDAEQTLKATLGELQTVLAACHVVTEEKSGSDVDNERHYQNQNTDSSDSEPCLDSAGDNDPLVIPFGLVLKAIPEALAYAQSEIRRENDLIDLAAMLRGMLGISLSAWREAMEAMGPPQAAVTLCCILERISEIRSPGGYLRALTAKAREGRFSIGPMVMAQLQREPKKS